MSVLALMMVAAVATQPPRDRAPAAVARKVATDYADCVWRSDRNRVRGALDLEVDGNVDLIKAFGLDRCPIMAGSMKVPQFVLRGLLFERMYHADFNGSSALLSFDGAGPAAYPVAPRSNQSETAKNYRGLMRIGDCVVRRAPLQARALLSSSVATGAEARAIAALEPLFASCQAPLAAVPFSAEMMRGTVAEPLYRLTRAAVPLARREEVAQ
jgi:hypothetical protein